MGEGLTVVAESTDKAGEEGGRAMEREVVATVSKEKSGAGAGS